MTIQEELGKVRSEASSLRKKFADTWNAWQKQRQRNQQLHKDLQHVQTENRQLKQKVKELEEALKSVTATKEKYQGMIFKAAVQPRSHANERTPRGGQPGHRGTARSLPTQIDVEKEVYVTHCPTCTTPVAQTTTTYERIVVDIPVQTTVTTQYHIQRQWCRQCQKEIHGVPTGTLPGMRFGTNIVSWVLLQKYRIRTPSAKIVELAKTLYQLNVSVGGIHALLAQLKKRFGPQYDQMLTTIRNAKVKHADETSWRIEGTQGWCWLFSTPKTAYYTIETTRGKGVPERVLRGSSPNSVLVRDDYGGYTNLPLQQQSCWSHLLRVSHELAVLPNVSTEMTTLHAELKALFSDLQQHCAEPFAVRKRQAIFAAYTTRLKTIEQQTYHYADSQKVQTRIRHQHTHLLTALLHPHVPLTNNHAERQIRPMAIIRKISGGSRSAHGAAIQAVLMSIVQTLALRKQSIMTTIPKLLALPAQHYAVVLDKGE